MSEWKDQLHVGPITWPWKDVEVWVEVRNPKWNPKDQKLAWKPHLGGGKWKVLLIKFIYILPQWEFMLFLALFQFQIRDISGPIKFKSRLTHSSLVFPSLH